MLVRRSIKVGKTPQILAEYLKTFSSSAAVVLELRDGRQINLLPTGEEIATSASPIAVGEVVLLTTEHGLLAFAQPREKPLLK